MQIVGADGETKQPFNPSDGSAAASAPGDEKQTLSLQQQQQQALFASPSLTSPLTTTFEGAEAGDEEGKLPEISMIGTCHPLAALS